MIPFAKMHGIGNDFVMLNGFSADLPPDLPALAQQVCDRRFGIGSDGLIAVDRGIKAPFRMRMWNPDGSDGGMCGNGTRCAALMLRDGGLIPEGHAAMEVGERVTTLELLTDGQVRVDMGAPELEPSLIGLVGVAGHQFVDADFTVDGSIFKATAVSMGNPHIVLFVEDVDGFDLSGLGPKVEHHPLFANRTNVHVAQTVGPRAVRMRSWERGAGITLACGSGACAVGVAAILSGRVESPVKVHLVGGDLDIEWDGGHVFKTGPAAYSFTGVWC